MKRSAFFLVASLSLGATRSSPALADDVGSETDGSSDERPINDPAGTGTITIVTDAKGDAFTRHRSQKWDPSGQVGSSAPLTLTLPAGRNRVKVDFHEGADAENITLRPGENRTVKLYSAKEWLKHFQFFMSFSGGDLMLPFATGTRFTDSGDFGAEGYSGYALSTTISGSVTAGLKIPVHDRIELRTVVHGSLGGAAFAGMARFEGIFRFGIGSVYGIEMGPSLGGLFKSQGANGYGQRAFFVVGPKWSALSLRMGPHRNIGLSFDQGIVVALHHQPAVILPRSVLPRSTDYTAAYEQSLSLSFLTL